MIMKKMRMPLWFLLMITPLFCSCAGRINGSLLAGGQADLQISVSLEPRMAALIVRLASASGQEQAGANVLDGPAISASMRSAPGVGSVSLANTAPAALAGPVRISRLGDFLAHSAGRDAGSSFITFEQGPQGGRCLISLSLETGPAILALLSEEIGDYLSALMAPIATGEVLTKAEYLDLAAMVYSRAIADEIAQSRIRASLDFPGAVQSARGGTFSGRRAEFDIPLLDMLVLESPLSFEVTWR